VGGEHRGQDVAVKVIKTYSQDDLHKIFGVGPWFCYFPRVDALTESRIEVLQGGRDMEHPSTSKCVAADRSDND